MNEFTQMMQDKQQAHQAQRQLTPSFSALVDDDIEASKSRQVMKLLGIDKPQPIVEKNISKSIYFTPKALRHLDKATKESGYPNRSKFLNALLERMYTDD